MPPIILATDCSEEMRCALCLDSWKNPIELVPCGHIFCKECVDDLDSCPMCRQRPTNTKKPNRTLVNMALAIPVKCASCGWTGTREQGDSHTCRGAAGVSSATLGAAHGPKHPVMVPTGETPWRAFGLSQNEYDEIMALFTFFDDNESGGLDRREVGRLARWLNFARTDKDIDRMFRDMDADGSGTMSLNEFLTWLRHNRPDPKALYGLSQSEYNTIMMQFRMYDTDQNGLLSMDEFARLVVSTGDVRDFAEGQRLFYSIDMDRSGAVDLHEFLAYRLRMRGGGQ
ncbi:EF hand [Trypanosoma grayi]|uniref:EF hand n=1 Tax=Trypanosoma grayi TaxID=71804 RepID=UPI0004F40DF8|nr:EF hand [Trypanosoma grayi]KEG12036.1 EF hand [Trypanosoma grayi]